MALKPTTSVADNTDKIYRAGMKYIEKLKLPVIPLCDGVPCKGLKFKNLLYKPMNYKMYKRIYHIMYMKTLKTGQTPNGVAVLIPDIETQQQMILLGFRKAFHVVIDIDSSKVIDAWKNKIAEICRKTLCVKTKRGIHIHLDVDEPVKPVSYSGVLDIISARHPATMPPSKYSREEDFYYMLQIGGKTIVYSDDILDKIKVLKVNKQFIEKLVEEVLRIDAPKPREAQNKKKTHINTSSIPFNPLKIFETPEELVELIEKYRDNPLMPKCLLDIFRRHPKGERFIYGTVIITLIHHLVRKHSWKKVEEVLRKYLEDYPNDDKQPLDYTLRKWYEARYWSPIIQYSPVGCRNCVYKKYCGGNTTKLILILPTMIYILLSNRQDKYMEEELLGVEK